VTREGVYVTDGEMLFAKLGYKVELMELLTSIGGFGHCNCSGRCCRKNCVSGCRSVIC
jgi:hypothetical protein